MGSNDSSSDDWVRDTESTAYENSTSRSVRTDGDNYTHVVYDRDSKEIHHMDSRIRGRKYNWGYGDDEQGWEDEDEGRSGGGCYIATATLGEHHSLELLDPLKVWRYNVLESTLVGLKLSNFYRRTAPGIATKIAQMPLARYFLFRLFA